MMTDLLPCPFCGSKNIDPKGWASTDRAGPACDDCAGSADTVEIWNTRPGAKHIEVDIGAAAAALQSSPELCAMMNEMVGGPALVEAQSQIERLQEALRFIGDWVARPPSAFSMGALDVVFKKIRNKIDETLGVVSSHERVKEE
jgi:hypothetical protein